jgi:hypothetical protein
MWQLMVQNYANLLTTQYPTQFSNLSTTSFTTTSSATSSGLNMSDVIDVENSFYVGDACGRVNVKHRGFDTYDHSSDDINHARNII